MGPAFVVPLRLTIKKMLPSPKKGKKCCPLQRKGNKCCPPKKKVEQGSPTKKGRGTIVALLKKGEKQTRVAVGLPPLRTPLATPLPSPHSPLTHSIYFTKDMVQVPELSDLEGLCKNYVLTMIFYEQRKRHK